MRMFSRPAVRSLGLVLLVATISARGDVEAQRQGAQRSDAQRDVADGRNFDARASVATSALTAAPVASAAQFVGLARLQAQIPDLLVSVDDITGGTRSVFNPVGPLTESGGDAFDVGFEWIRANVGALGLRPADLSEYEVTDRVFSAVSGVTHLYLRQQYRGIPVYNAQLHFSVTSDGRLLIVNNQFVPDLATVVAGLDATVAPGEAVRAAVTHYGDRLDFAPTTLASDASAQQVSQVAHESVSLQPIEAKLMYLPIQPGEVRLVWNFQIHTTDSQHAFDYTVDAASSQVWTRFDWVAADSYRVYARPLESPSHNTTTPPPADGRSLLTNPHNATASPYAWHDTNGSAGADYTNMRGNNVHAYDDIDNNNAPPAMEPGCGAGIACDFASDLTLAPGTYTAAAVANLFYWNNIVHDVQYQYGFDEAGGNFQQNTYGRGGPGAIGGDYVEAEAQDGSGVNSSTFLTPPDGLRPRMQMFRWTSTTPERDGDYDAGIIVHEYGHGISNRLVGGPSNVSCLQNTQQPGEGLSDWWALAYTHRSGDTGSTGRGIGTYLLGQTTDGAGLRTQRYSPNPDINTWTYNSIQGLVDHHPIGAVWAQAAWEVYWSLVNHYGFNADLYNATGGSGNQRAMLYLNEGLKATACSPTFIDVRNGIIAATQAFNGGADTCRVWDAFAAFGLGLDATTGGPNSTVATNGFARPAACGVRTARIGDAAIFEGNAGQQNAAIGISLSPSSSTTLTMNYATTGGTATPSAYMNSNSTAIPSVGAATPYPSTITVPALGGAVTKVTVAVNSFSHTWPRDVDMLLVGPTGQTLVLLSDGGSGSDAVNVNLVFDDAGMPVASTTIPSGTYRPTNIEDNEPTGDSWPGPAPAGPYGTTLAGFNGLNPTGEWKLFVVDDVGGDEGSFSSWSLTFQTSTPPDYTTVGGRVIFGPSQIGSAVNVPVLGDTTVEPNETIFVTLSNFNGGAIADGTGVITIVDDDSTPVAAVMTSPASGSVIPASTNFMWTAGAAVAEYHLDVGFSLDGTDIYSASQGLGTSRTVTIPQTGDTIYVRLWSRHPSGWVIQYYTYIGGSAPTGTYLQGHNNTAVPIPDLTTIESPINIANFRGTLGEVRVSFHLTHGSDDHLDISLVGPDGTTVDLTSDNGGNADNYGTTCSPQTSRTTLADDAGPSILVGQPPYVGRFRPEQLLSAFNGKRGADVNGTWKLRITDDTGGDVGVLSCWSLFLEPNFDNNSAMAILDGGTIDSPITVAGITRPISKLRVSMYISHPDVADLDISLISPDGTLLDLSSDNGGGGVDYGSSCAPQNSRTTFSDTAGTSITAGAAPFVGTFRPEVPLSTLRSLPPLYSNGMWRLRISDDLGGTAGTLHCWSLFIETPTQSNFDTEGDVRSEVGIYRPSTGGWFLLKSSTNFTSYDSYSWGTGTDLPVPGDYDADGRSDVAIYRPSTGAWFVLKSSSNFTTFDTYSWGAATDRPVPGDYDGDGITDVAIYRPSTGTWFVLKSSTSFMAFDSYSWGNSTDVPVPGDYDGDGTTDVAIYRPSTGSWFVLQSSSNFTTFSSYAWGAGTDVPVRGDFDGDGRTDVTVYRPSTGQWFVLQSSSNFTSFFSHAWGSPTDVPVSGDYDGDGTSDITIFRPSTGEWLVLRSSSGFSTYMIFSWGASSDVPLPR